MDEQTWLTCDNPRLMLNYLDSQERILLPRKLRLFACAWWSTIPPHQAPHEEVVRAIEFHEIHHSTGRDTQYLINDCLRMAYKDKNLLAIGAALLRDIVGNPYRPTIPILDEIMVQVEYWRDSESPSATFSIRWKDPVVRALAQSIYDERAFEKMPILGDALEDSGFQNLEIIDHCRGPGPHVRGCWILDLILGDLVSAPRSP